MRATEFVNKQQGVAEDTLNEFATDSGGGGDDILKTLAAQWLNGDVSSGDLDSDIQSQEKVERRLEKGVTCPDGVKRKLYIDYSDDYEGVVIYGDDNWSITYKQDDLSESHQGVAEGHLNEDVGGNYLYYSVESSNDAKLILSSGHIEASGGAQTATQQQTKLPVVSVSRSIYYAVSGANVERDYKVVFVLDRNAIESRYKTFGTSQHEPTKSDDTIWNASSMNYKIFQKYSKIDTNRDGKMSDQEFDAYYAIPGNTTLIDKRPSAVMAQLLNQKYATLLTKYNRSKSGKEFEEVIPVKSGQLPLKGILVGFYLVPNKAAAKDQELLNNPMRLAMPRPNTFVKVIQQGMAEGSIPVYKSPSQFYAGGKKIYQLFRSAFPNLPEHVANDIYNQTKPGTNETIVNALNQGQDPKRVFLDYYTGVTFNFQQDPGTNLTPEQLKKVLLNGKWKQQILLVNPADFSEHSRNRMIKRNFGINPDEDPIRIQRQQAKAKGDGSNEPVIIIQTSSGFVLWEGFHRTMSILSVGKNGNDPLKWNKVKLRAWVVTFETQGVAEGSEVNSNLNVLHNKKTYQQTLQVLQTAYGDEEGQQMLDQYIQAVDQLIHSGGTIYRGVWVSPGKKPRLKNAGQHWTLTAQAAEEYLDSNAGWSAYADFQSDNKGIQPVPYIISAQVGPNSITNNGVSFDQFPEELEVRLVNPQTAKMKIVKKVEGLALESRYPVGQLQSQAQERGSQGVAEAWSEKYKRSINCDNPKGFSQRAHCQGRKKNNEQIELDERKKKRKTTKKTNRYFYGPVYYGGYYGTGDGSGDSGGGE